MIRAFFCTIFSILLCFAGAPSVFADSSARIREATEAFRSGDYLKAAEGFREAEQAKPSDLRLAFNQGSSLAAVGKFDEAVEVLKKSALAPDKKIATNSLNLLGQIAVDRVKQLLSAPPESTPTEQHAEVFEKLRIAEQYYAEALSLDPENSEALLALELIRAWRTRIHRLWDLAERQTKRQSDFLERLRWLENWQEELGRNVAEKNGEPNSPKKFQAFYRTAENQNRLTEELAVLRDDFQKELEQQRSGQNQAGNSSKTDEKTDSNDRALELIVEELQRLKEASETTRHQLRSFQTDAAKQTVQENFNRLNRLRMNLAPFEMIVREAEQLQSNLCNENPERTRDGSPNSAAEETERNEDRKTDSTEHALRQRRIGTWMPLLVFKAKESLQHLDENGSPPQGSTTGSASPDERKKPFELAVQYGPEIQRLAQQASEKLQAIQYSEALPDQEEALRLLREILQSTDNQSQKQQQNQDDNRQDQQQSSNQNQQNQQDRQDQRDQENPNGQGQQAKGNDRRDDRDQNEQQQNEKDGKDGEQQQQQQQQHEKKPDDNKNNQDSPQDSQEQQGGPDQQEQKPQNSEQVEPQSDWNSKNDSTEQDESKPAAEKDRENEANKDRQKDIEKAERMLRQVRRKQQEASEKRERIRTLLRRLEPVEKDW